MTVDESDDVDITFHELDVVRWEEIVIDASALEVDADCLDEFRRRMQETLEKTESRTLALRVRIVGQSPIHDTISARPQSFRGDIRAIANDYGEARTWIEKVKIHTKPCDSGITAHGTDDAMAELAGVIESLTEDESSLVELLEQLEPLRAKLPAEFWDGKEDQQLMDLASLKSTVKQAYPALASRLHKTEGGMMRIDRLELRAFGPFTDHILDLSKGNQGLHVIYGPNEAGKSSALRAITQMFYGIPARSTDDFVHQKTQMRIGAMLRNGKDCLNFVRRKGTKSTLRDEQDDKIIDETDLLTFLGGLDEDTFGTVFGLHHDQLVEGGRMILDGKGNIGQALFAASAGLSGLRTAIASLQEETGELFKPSASKPRINAAISEFKNKKKELKDLQLRPEEWVRIDKALTDAQAERELIEGTIKSFQASKHRLERISEAIPLGGET